LVRRRDISREGRDGQRSPLRVRHEDGVLTVDYERPPRPGLLSWLSGWGRRRYRAVLSLAVPRDCRVELRVISASLMVSGEITLAGLGGSADAETISGSIEASGVSGDLTVRLPGASDLRVTLQSTSGQVASAFEELTSERTPGRHAAEGRLGAGAGRLRATSTSGHVALLRRAPEARS
jgi:hypothetical protein